MTHSRKETIKTIVITILITAIGAFIAGMHYEASKTAQLKADAANLVKNVKVEVSQAPSK